MMCGGYYYEHGECKTECVVLIYQYLYVQDELIRWELLPIVPDTSY